MLWAELGVLLDETSVLLCVKEGAFERALAVLLVRARLGLVVERVVITLLPPVRKHTIFFVSTTLVVLTNKCARSPVLAKIL